MTVVGVLLIGAGVFLMFEAWESHKKGTPPAPIQKAISSVQQVAGTGQPSNVVAV